MTTSERSYIPVIDWLKCLGMVVILLGHLAGGYVNSATPPIYPKQLGVAFFIFAMGYSLARESRPGLQVLYNRLFEVVLWGVSVAILVSAVSLIGSGRGAFSNFLPFLFGVNVLLNHFPANPTTWYIGTYFHLLVLWLAIRNLRVTWIRLAIVLMVEITTRTLLIERGSLFIAYMTFPSWLGAFAAGLFATQRGWQPQRQPWRLAVLLVTISVLWYVTVWPFVSATTFPFMAFGVGVSPVRALMVSTAVSTLYLGFSVVAFQVFFYIATPTWVRFCARNTLLIFIAHMPVFFWLDPWLVQFGLSYPIRAFTEIAVCLPGLAFVSEVVHCLVPVKAWRDSIGEGLGWRLVQHDTVVERS